MKAARALAVLAAVNVCKAGDEIPIPPAVLEEIEKLVCQAVKDEVPEDKFASTTCEDLKSKLSFLPEGMCEDVVKKVFEDTLASCPKIPNKVLLFNNFMTKYNRAYATEAEKEKRFQVFSDNIDTIYASNSLEKSYTLGVTANADLTFEEWRAQYLTGFRPSAKASHRTVFTAPAAFVEPESVDWVAQGGVTSVKNQGQCGSCWAFSTVGALEGAMHVSGRKMVDLSMQHIMACDHVDSGCQGGLMDHGFDFVAQGGVTSLADEPYLCMNQESAQCKSMRCSSSYPLVLQPGDVEKHTDVDQSENALEAAVAQQPVSVAIEADQAVFQHYTGGILTSDACGSQLDHGVLAVGYGVDGGQKYWKVKNSWGTSFGEKGYIRLARGKSGGGECGIRKAASYPTVGGGSSIVAENPQCSVWGIVGCGAAAAAAAAACGGPLDPADSACILAALAAIPGCGPCACAAVGCPSWCPCGQAEIDALLAKNSTVVV